MGFELTRDSDQPKSIWSELCRPEIALAAEILVQKNRPDIMVSPYEGSLKDMLLSAPLAE